MATINPYQSPRVTGPPIPVLDSTRRTWRPLIVSINGSILVGMGLLALATATSLRRNQSTSPSTAP